MADVARSIAPVSEGELAACVATLRRLHPSELGQPRLLELWEVGHALFSSRIIKQRFGSDDVVAFLKKQGNYRGMLKRLEKLHAEVERVHAQRVGAATQSGMNSSRIQRTKEVAQHGLVALSAGAEAQRSAHGQMLISSGLDNCVGTPGSSPTEASRVVRTRDTPAAATTPAAVALVAGNDNDDGLRRDAQGKVLGWAGGTDANVCSDDDDTSDVDAETEVLGGLRDVTELRAALPKGSFRKTCNVCKKSFEGMHHFYHQLCVPCADFNYAKRTQQVNLRGYVAILTGGRVRIGYQIALRLLRCGATCHVTTRFVSDAALRFSLEPDYEEWSGRLQLYYLELCDLPSVEAFCQAMVQTLPKLDILINNAAQTLTRPEQWTASMAKLEQCAAAQLTDRVRERITLHHSSAVGGYDAGRLLHDVDVAPPGVTRQTHDDTRHSESAAAQTRCSAAEVDHLVASSSGNNGSASSSDGSASVVPTQAVGAAVVPLDESGQPLDLSGVNSWSRRLADVSIAELLQTMAVNAAAPFLLCSKLKPLLAKAAAAPETPTPTDLEHGGDDEHTPAPPSLPESAKNADARAGLDESPPSPLLLRCTACVKAGRHLSPHPCQRCAQHAPDSHPPRSQATGNRGDDRTGAKKRNVRYAHVVNVSALEGKFAVGKKSTAHPHTNMAKAALNMMTHTCARDFISSHILVNCVDTGWVTDMAPLGKGAVAKTHKTHVGPPLDEQDGAARVTDPIYLFVTEGSTMHGVFFKDYHPSPW
jgi:NAD(P)-dependent dehydrogenase (short-subunit alcohol dehydrogenase family)